MPRFRLQTALNVRKRLEKLKQKDFAEEVQVEQKIHYEMELIQQQLETNTQQANESRMQSVGIAKIQFHLQFQTRLEAKLKTLEEQLKFQKQCVETIFW